MYVWQYRREPREVGQEDGVMKRWWSGGWGMSVLLMLPAFVAAQQTGPAAEVPPTVNAVWVEHEVNLNYMGFTSYYSCDGLRDKVVWVLKQLGARPDFKVTTRGCSRSTGPELMPGVRIVAALPAEATPEVLAQIASEASKRELVARAKGISATAAEATAQFPARVKRIEFRSARTGAGQLQDGDCEFMEQARRQLFPQLGVRVVQGQASCTPNQLTLGAVQLTVEVLEPVPES